MVFRVFRNYRRRRIKATPFPGDWLEIIERRVAYYRILPQADKRELLEHVAVFVAEKHFEGAGGLEITMEMKIVVAAQACILLLHRNTDYYPTLRSIVLYPSTYIAPQSVVLAGGVVSEQEEIRLGESWGMGCVVLAWDEVLESAHDIHDGRNLVLHEFAHQLDEEDGDVDGVPALPSRSQYAPWARILGREFAALIDDIEQNRTPVMDAYGAESPAEFFAVLTETFFEKPVELLDRHPELYAQLKLYYNQDPARILGGDAAGRCNT